MNEFEIVRVNDKLTLEVTGATVTIRQRDILQIASIMPAEEDIGDYALKTQDFIKMLDENKRTTSRRNVISYVVKNDLDLNCITVIQVLLDRINSKLLAYIRSSNLKKLDSDLGFLCRLAISAECDEVVVSIGSAHIYL